MNADRIYADPSTITGSIGIFGLIPTIPRTLDKIGVHTDGVGTTRFAGAFDITRPLDPEVGAMIQSVIDKGYRDFTGRVAQARGTQRRRDRRDRARPRVERRAGEASAGWSTRSAASRTPSPMPRRAPSSASPTTTSVRYIEKPATPFERFFTGFAQNRVAAAMAARFEPRAQALLRARAAADAR